ncbi:MAG: DUF4139 domain-containing protein [Candidatus Altiarchaeota archaeon]
MDSGKLVMVLLLTAALATSGCSETVPSGQVGASSPNDSGGLEVTVYNNNLGVVKEGRSIDLRDGLTSYSFEGVASQVDPTSVKLKSADGSFAVLEQNYKYDLVSKEKLLEKYIGKTISGFKVMGQAKEPVDGVLLSASWGDLILQRADGSIEVVSVSDLILPSLPEGLIVKPTLEWLLTNRVAGAKQAELSYMTGGMSWSADYVVVTNKDDDRMDLNGWVTITNNAGATFKDAALKLVAGDVNRVQAPSMYGGKEMYAMEDASSAANQFQEQQLFEYHMYDLQRRTTLNDKQQKQISLLEAKNSPVEKEYVFEGQGGWYNYGSTNTKVQVKLNFNNSQAGGLGMPLPKGRVRVFKEDSAGKLQFVGEDSIDHTPKDETVRLIVGNAFDIVGERKQVKVNDLGCQYEVIWEDTLRNHKDTAVTVTVLENAYWDWTITSENYPHFKESNQRIRWRIPVAANGEAKLTYTIRYNNC